MIGGKCASIQGKSGSVFGSFTTTKDKYHYPPLELCTIEACAPARWSQACVAAILKSDCPTVARQGDVQSLLKGGRLSTPYLRAAPRYDCMRLHTSRPGTTYRDSTETRPKLIPIVTTQETPTIDAVEL